MGRKLKSIRILEDSENSPESSGDSPRAAVSSKIASTSASSSNRSRRSVQKKVVSVPIKDMQRLSAPPPDSWAWRKYGQKPIKGSPYPRGYYRCSSSKGCPARKQVERSKVDPDMIMVTYSCEHNHPSPPASRSNLYRSSLVQKNSVDSVSEDELEEDDEEEEEEEVEEEEEEEEEGSEMEKNPSDSVVVGGKLDDGVDMMGNLVDAGTLISGGEFEWFADFEASTSRAMLESPILMDDDMVFTMGEEEDSLFADLGELPECSTVFRREMAAEQRRHSVATTTS
ncbi:probable WRKY transcription factor 65 [Andrographis paniculata]|uniref:probable WRKY transcription factor 65 n=1 Tax=Andrographis paniculata TaxID=175694 RepID=UPI0021E975A7|nr:probable WRKY transcription factor 65 [Andrographis paniculata]